MSIWVIPFLIVAAIVGGITAVSVRKTSRSVVEGRDEIPGTIAEHPFTLNPIIWVILVTTVFIFIVIAYYAWGFG